MRKGDFEKIIGYEEIKEELEKILDIILNKDKYQKLNAFIPSGILLNGQPGVGKTILCKSFIDATKIKSYVLRKDKPNGSFVKEIKDVFDEAAKNAPSIVFLDDMDKFASDDNSRNKEEFVVIQSCIDNCKGKNVFVIATTNGTRNIPESLLRNGRIDKIINVEPPTLDDAKKIIEHYLNKKGCVKDVDSDLIAHLLVGTSCATLEKVVNQAGILAGWQDKTQIELDDIIRAILEEKFGGCELKREKSDNYKRLAAYHESGHTLIKEMLEPGSVNLVSIKNYNSRNGGITCANINPNFEIDIKCKENEIKTLLAGKAATEIVFGVVDFGTGSDIDKAYDLTYKLCEDYCIQDFNNFDGNFRTDSRRDALREIIGYSLSMQYLDTKKMLIENKERLDKIADALMKKDYLTQNDIKKLLS